VARFVVVILVAITLLACSSSAQNLPPAGDSRAVALATQSIAALTHGSAISDVRLTANVTWFGPEPEAGSGVLLAKGNSESHSSSCRRPYNFSSSEPLVGALV
jgi:hypothetical protein